jgi:hypothetical protein
LIVNGKAGTLTDSAAGAVTPAALSACDSGRTGLTFLGNFEGSTPFADWSVNEATGTPWGHSMVRSPTRECQQATRIELRRSDPLMGRSHRSEIKIQNTRGNGTIPAQCGDNPIGTLGCEVWLGWSVYIPDDWTIEPRYAPETIMQTAQAGRSPAFEIQINGDSFQTFTRTGKGPKEDPSWVTTTTATTPMTRGAWTDFVMHAKWSAGAEGLLQVWQNGAQIVNRAGPNAFSDWSPKPYLKLGIYKWSWKGKNSVAATRVLYLDAVRIVSGNTGSYALVAPR